MLRGGRVGGGTATQGAEELRVRRLGGLGFRVSGLGFFGFDIRIRGLGFGVWGLGLWGSIPYACTVLHLPPLPLILGCFLLVGRLACTAIRK